VGGLATLKIYGRERRQAARLKGITDHYRKRTMTVLRVSFLSGFVLELAASLSVAIIAVSIGLRLVDGSLELAVGLFVLLLAPDAFLPVRNVGTQFHAAADGVAAAEEVFTILEDDGGPAPTPVTERTMLDPGQPPPLSRTGGALRFDDVTIRRGGSAVVDGFTAEFRPGEVSVITGRSGVGKSTLVAALLGFVEYEGTIILGEQVVTPGAPRDWLAWAGQRPGLFSGTVAHNVALGDARVDPGLVELSLDWAGIGSLDPETPLAVNGEGLSGGQAQRVAAARAIYRSQAHGCPVVVFDEPSSALDENAERALIDGLGRLASEGIVVVVVSHRPALLEASDHVVRLGEVVRV
jgi:ATP-binding cassette, subfamily C, bacterial CydD